MNRKVERHRGWTQRALDLLTLLILASAMALAWQPGSAIRRRADAWVTLRRIDGALASAWTELTSVATPLGPAAAAPAVIEFSDYECTFCRAAAPSVDSATKAGLAIAVVHSPSPARPSARLAALLALCAEEQGILPAIHMRLMTSEEWRKANSIMELARVLDGARADALATCTEREDVRLRLERHIRVARRLQIPGTPLFVGRQGALRDAPSVASLRKLAQR